MLQLPVARTAPRAGRSRRRRRRRSLSADFPSSTSCHSDATSACFNLTTTSRVGDPINQRQRPYNNTRRDIRKTHRSPLQARAPTEEDLSLYIRMHDSKHSMNYTHQAARGDVASGAIPVSVSATAVRWRTGQRTAADRVRALRSLGDSGSLRCTE
jgi:hypothetical protein